MFNNKPYQAVNREERFYCALFAHALLSSQLIRQRFADLVQSKLRVVLEPATFQVFLEAATLRDYWNDLGDPFTYTPETHNKRRDVLESIFNFLGVPPEAIDKHHVFWTTDEHRKLWSPGRWKSNELANAGLDQLKKVKWAFNAKPDILILSKINALMLEGKVESGEGRDQKSGYRQLEIQEMIVNFLNLLVPQFKTINFTNAVLALCPAVGISWLEVITMVEGGGLDDFTFQCLSQLKSYYH